MTWAPCPHGVRARGKKTPPMSHDPWMEDSNSLDLTDNVEDRVHVPLHSHVTTRSG